MAQGPVRGVPVWVDTGMTTIPADKDGHYIAVAHPGLRGLFWGHRKSPRRAAQGRGWHQEEVEV